MTSNLASSTPSPVRFSSRDGAVFGLLLLVVLALAWNFLGAKRLPFEDAAMLMRYAENLAQGHGIVWNVGEKPVDGATDFLFLLALAGVRKIGFSLESAVIFIGVASHLITTFLVYCGARFTGKTNRVVACVAALSFAFGSGLFLVKMFFGTPFFALFCSLSWAIALVLYGRRDDSKRDGAWNFAFATSCLLMALTRPEGVLMAVFMLASLLILRPRKQNWALIGVFTALFVVAGGAYFAWHWQVFEHPLPNPYYKKGGGRFYPFSLLASWQNSFAFGQIFAPIFVLGLLVPSARRFTVFCCVPLIFFASVWVLLSNEMNSLARFQYAQFPIFCLSWPLILQKIAVFPAIEKIARRKRLMWPLGLMSLCLLGVSAWQRILIFESRTDGMLSQYPNYEAARILAPFAGRGYTLATTEAGIIPLYSGWRSVDLWGLNDAWIAHNGGVTESYLAQVHPQVILIHAPYDARQAPHAPPKLTWNPARYPLGYGWFAMCRTTTEFAQKNGFRLAALYNSAGDDYGFYLWVAPNFRDSLAIERELHQYLNNSMNRNVLAKTTRVSATSGK